MDKKALQSYATWSKQYLEQQIELSLKSLGIHSDDDIREAKRVGDVTIIDGDATSYPAELKEQRDSIIKLIRISGYQNAVEEFAYTWFNRIVALRFMEIHEFLPHGFRILSDRSGGIEPEIIKNLSFVKSELSLDMGICSELKNKNDIDGLFRYVLFKQCNALSKMLPMLFDMEDAYLELILPKTLLKGETVITKLLDIPENVFMDDIEIIGWLYQYYISAKKDKVFSDLKKNIKISSDNIPAATQLFTPDWIVRYMVENSLGRIWTESYPNSPLKTSMRYYLDEVKQDSVVETHLQDIRYKNINPEDIKVLEPCCGSGHILVYLFDLLYKMYEEKGYMPREIPTLILSKNLYGLEIDKRASQLASFALVMRARSINNRFFDEKYYVRPQVFEIYSSKEFIDLNYCHQLSYTSLNEEEKNEISKIVDLFADAKNIGSLIDTRFLNFTVLDKAVEKLKLEVLTTFNVNVVHLGTPILRKLIAQAKVMARKYDVCVTNPPYMGGSGMNSILSEYVKDRFPNSKSDLFSCFIEKGFDYVKTNGFNCMVTMQSWMFLSSFEKMRKEILSQKTIVGLMHMDNMVMGIAFGTAVSNIRNVFVKAYKAQYVYVTMSDIVDGNPIDFPVVNSRFNSISSSNYERIPGNPIAYWASERVIDAFSSGLLGEYAYPKQGFATGSNDMFLRQWTEVDSKKIGFGFKDSDSASHSSYKWFPCNKGGEFRRWYGNNSIVVDWENDGIRMKSFKGSVIRNPQFYFKKGITWSSLTNGALSMRYSPEGFLFESKGSVCFFKNEKNLLYVLGLVNTKIVGELLKFLSPTVDYHEGPMSRVPIIFDDEKRNQIEAITRENVSLSKLDWDSFETSWDFEQHPFMKCTTSREEERIVVNTRGDSVVVSPIGYAYANWMFECEDRFNKLKYNEEELNRIFITVYGLQEELTPEVADEDITVRKADLQRDIKSFISYLVGIVMGRYSLDVTGLAYAGGDWDISKYKTYQPDDDGIVPIYVGVGMEDGLTGRITDLIKLIFGEESFRENMDFIAEGLGKASNESSVETLNRYLNDGFYADHLKVYQKRPIYWMFSSGKNKGFKCLVYMHRYNKDTLARINAKYYLPESTRQKIELEDLDNQIKTAEGKDRIRLEKSRTKLFDKYNETIEYGQVLDHMSNKYIDIDLDDGVKVNYEKFQGVELVSDSGVKIKKDLLVPLK